MEDAATAEISRTQLWQWIRHGAALADGRRVDVPLFRAVMREELAAIKRAHGEEAFAAGRYAQAAALFDQLISAPELPDFLTLPAYDLLTQDSLPAGTAPPAAEPLSFRPLTTSPTTTTSTARAPRRSHTAEGSSNDHQESSPW